MTTRIYDLNEVTVSVFGIEIKGYGEDEFVRIEEESNTFDDKVGGDGDVTRSKTNDRRGTATLVLMQSSPVNALLSAVWNADVALPNGAGVGSFLVRDRQGSSIYRSAEAWIMKPPDVAFGKAATEREWPIRLAKVERLDGGN